MPLHTFINALSHYKFICIKFNDDPNDERSKDNVRYHQIFRPTFHQQKCNKQ